MADTSCDAGTAVPCMIAVAQIDDCTNMPIVGESNAYVFDGVRAVNWEPVIEEAETAAFKDDCGNVICRHDENSDQMTGLTIEFEKCILPFELINLLTGQPLVTTEDDTVGWYHSTEVKSQPRVAVIVYEKKIDCRNAAWRRIIFPNVRFSIPVPGSESDLIRIHSLTAQAAPGYLAAYGSGPFNTDQVLGWADLPETTQGAIGVYDTNDAPPAAQCGLVPVLPQEDP